MLIQVENLRKRFRTPSGSFVDAVDGVSFDVRRGETVGLVGESGCGKSTVGRCILRLTDPDAGRIVFDGSAIERLSQRQLRQLRQRIQIVFQDPLGSTNPAFSLRQTLGDALRQAGVARDERPARIRWIGAGTSYPVANYSVAPSPGRSRRAPSSCSSMSQPPRSTFRCAARSSTSWPTFRTSLVMPTCLRRTI
jgi:ABC-type oligopeptide transport system ATPase subunit